MSDNANKVEFGTLFDNTTAGLQYIHQTAGQPTITYGDACTFTHNNQLVHVRVPVEPTGGWNHDRVHEAAMTLTYDNLSAPPWCRDGRCTKTARYPRPASRRGCRPL